MTFYQRNEALGTHLKIFVFWTAIAPFIVVILTLFLSIRLWWTIRVILVWIMWAVAPLATFFSCMFVVEVLLDILECITSSSTGYIGNEHPQDTSNGSRAIYSRGPNIPLYATECVDFGTESQPIFPSGQAVSLPEQIPDGVFTAIGSMGGRCNALVQLPQSPAGLQDTPSSSLSPLPPNSVDQPHHAQPQISKRIMFGSGSSLVALLVGIGDESLPGPQHDIDLLDELFGPYHTVYSIKGPHTTREIVHQQLRKAFRAAMCESVPVVLYFTGHEDRDNRFWLNESESLSADNLLLWIQSIRQETGENLPVYIAFDHCRSSLDLPRLPDTMHEHIYIVWACSPRQKAEDVCLNKNMPYSQFLKALVLTLNELLSMTPTAIPPLHNSNGEFPFLFLEKLRRWTTAVVKIHRGVICDRAGCNISWTACTCNICVSGSLCEHRHDEKDSTPVQTATGWFWEYKSDIDISGIVSYIWRSSCHIRRVSEHIKNNPWFRKYNGSELLEARDGAANSPAQLNKTTPLVATPVVSDKRHPIELFPLYQGKDV